MIIKQHCSSLSQVAFVVNAYLDTWRTLHVWLMFGFLVALPRLVFVLRGQTFDLKHGANCSFYHGILILVHLILQLILFSTKMLQKNYKIYRLCSKNTSSQQISCDKPLCFDFPRDILSGDILFPLTNTSSNPNQ